MEEVGILALAVWGLTWLVSFWSGTEWLRKRLGVGYDRDAEGNLIERWGSTRVGEWLNCPACCAVMAMVVVGTWWALGLPMMALKLTAALGLAVLVVRWWQGARVKAEWWI